MNHHKRIAARSLGLGVMAIFVALMTMAINGYTGNDCADLSPLTQTRVPECQAEAWWIAQG